MRLRGLLSPHPHQLLWLPDPTDAVSFLTFQREFKNMVTLFWRVFPIPPVTMDVYSFLVCSWINELIQLLMLIFIVKYTKCYFSNVKSNGPTLCWRSMRLSLDLYCTTKLTRKRLRRNSLCALQNEACPLDLSGHSTTESFV